MAKPGKDDQDSETYAGEALLKCASRNSMRSSEVLTSWLGIISYLAFVAACVNYIQAALGLKQTIPFQRIETRA